MKIDVANGKAGIGDRVCWQDGQQTRVYAKCKNRGIRFGKIVQIKLDRHGPVVSVKPVDEVIHIDENLFDIRRDYSRVPIYNTKKMNRVTFDKHTGSFNIPWKFPEVENGS